MLLLFSKTFWITMTIREIANKLNLSITTVSRALDGYSDVSPSTRALVQKTADEMGYTPNQAARQLRRNRADAIGFIIPSARPRFMDPYYSEFIAGLGDAAVENRLDLLVSSTSAGDASELKQYRTWAKSRKVDGFILNRVWLQDQRVRYLHQQGIPFAALEYTKDGIDYPRVEIQCNQQYRKLIVHLMEKGFRRIAYIGGPEGLKINYNSSIAIKEALIANGLVYDPRLVTTGDLTSLGGYQSAKRLISLPDPPNAILCVNDETAFGALHAVHEAGLVVGKNIAIAGFDGVQDAAYSEPPLTTLDQPVYQIARILVQMLAQVISGKTLKEHIVVIEPNLLIRQSTNGTEDS
jgi:LacI family transcriptional regulator